jgi:basic membrane lipoprotein Med (substrate-binding protein (PBP1-ABC) superfamily)
MLAASLLAGCAPAAPSAPVAPTSAPAAAQAATSKLKMAMILAGPVQDADFNALGYQTLKDLEKQFGVETAYSESVAVADAERVAREYVASGYNIVAFHGGQFVTIVQKLAGEFPQVSFIMESSGQIDGLPPNVWNVARKAFEPYYAVGVLAARSTKSNKIGFISGVKLPDFVSMLNAVKEAVQETNPKADVIYAFVGDQNDPIKARSSAASQINSGVDFVISTVNLGVTGVAEAVKATPNKVLLSTFMTEKPDLAPDRVVVSVLYHFGPSYAEAVKSIQAGKRGGYTEMRVSTNGFSLSQIANVSEDSAKEARNAFDAVAQGTKQVPEIVDKITGE